MTVVPAPWPTPRPKRVDRTLVIAAWRASRTKIYGLAFLLVVAGLVALSIAMYTKAFTSVTEVTLAADRSGNQLNSHADVKVRGVIVGEVRSVRSRPDGADLTLALQPSQTRLIPADVQARILPKTLFGEKYVQLVIPGDATDTSSPRIAAGDVITQDRSATAIELGTVFDDLLPVLRAVQPADLDAALNSVATALQGRGAALGDNLARFDAYLARFNPAVPQLEADLSRLADVADTFDAATPSLVALLANQSSISNTLVAKGDELKRVLVGTRGFTHTLGRVLRTNETDLVHLARISAPTLQTLKDNGQSIPYLFDGLTKLAPRVDGALGGNGPYLHITLSLAPVRGAYQPTVDCPTYDSQKGPNCAGSASNGVGAASSVAEANGRKPGTGTSGATGASYADGWSDPRGTRVEADQIAAIVSAVNGSDPHSFAALDSVLFGPLLRGSAVSLS